MLAVIGWEWGASLSWWLHPAHSHTWFLITLAVLYLLGPLVRAVPPLALAAALLLASQIVDPSWGAVARLGQDVTWFGAFFFTGAAAARHMHRVLSAPVWAFALAALVASVGALLRLFTDASDHVAVAMMAMLGICALSWLLVRLPDVAPVRGLQWLGRRSVVTYLWHYPILILASRSARG